LEIAWAAILVLLLFRRTYQEKVTNNLVASQNGWVAASGSKFATAVLPDPCRVFFPTTRGQWGRFSSSD
jgi:hypothetical protein